MEERQTYVVRNYKDTVFRMLFREKERLMELYNAVAQTSYTDVDQLEIVTLENAVYMSMKNDLAFIIDFGLYLYEHQSTINPNMPLRFLHYVSREYERLIDSKLLYGQTPVEIPTPHFVVLYNGVAEQPERQEQKLSDLYQSPCEREQIESAPEPRLELKVLVLNINQGKNENLLESCRTLKEYMLYTERVRTYRQTMPVRDAVLRAVNECIREDILSDFLSENKAEAIAMSIFEYDEEGLREVWRKECVTEGVQRTFDVKNLYSQGKSVREIASELNISEEQVKKMTE